MREIVGTRKSICNTYKDTRTIISNAVTERVGQGYIRLYYSLLESVATLLNCQWLCYSTEGGATDTQSTEKCCYKLYFSTSEVTCSIQVELKSIL